MSRTSSARHRARILTATVTALSLFVGPVALAGAAKAEPTAEPAAVETAVEAPPAPEPPAAGGPGEAAPTEPAVDETPTVVAPEQAPAVTGTPQVGATVTVTSDGWTPAATALTYQWFADEIAIEGATEATLSIPATLAGVVLRADVTGTLDGRSSAALRPSGRPSRSRSPPGRPRQRSRSSGCVTASRSSVPPARRSSWAPPTPEPPSA